MERVYLTVPNERAESFEVLLFEENPQLIGLTTIRERDFNTDFIIDQCDEDLESSLNSLLHSFLTN